MLIMGCEGRDQYVYYGEKKFVEHVRQYTSTLKEARTLLASHLKTNNKKYYYHPDEVIVAFNGGYLFVQGDFKTKIRLKGYFVNGEGNVAFINTGKSISVTGYHKKIGRNGWSE